MRFPLALLSCMPVVVGSLLQHDARAPFIPPPPVTPFPQPGDGQGAWGREKPTVLDEANYLQYRAMAVTAGYLGLPQASINLNRYLDNLFVDFENHPNFLIAEVPAFAEAVAALATEFAAPWYDELKARGGGGSVTFRSPWRNFYATKGLSADWYYALGGFSFAVTGQLVGVRSSTGVSSFTIYYVAYIFDRYNWDGDKSATIGPFNFTDQELGRMHVVGLAREYAIFGTSSIFEVPNWDGKVFPHPKVDGTRS